jgi:hypothetical protein
MSTQSTVDWALGALDRLLNGDIFEREKFVRGQLMVEEQTDFHRSKEKGSNALFHALVIDGNIEADNLEKNKMLLKVRDPVGACVVHIAYLYQIYPVGRMLVQAYPEECLESYGIPDDFDFEYDDEEYLPYTGENILHMAIVAQNIEEAKFLLEFYSGSANIEKSSKPPPKNGLQRLLDSCTTGHFFQPAKDKKFGVYFGEKPLLFAVCTNNESLLNLLLNYTTVFALLTTVDGHGNNALHMCVLKNLPEMYKLICEKINEIESNTLDELLKDFNGGESLPYKFYKDEDELRGLRGKEGKELLPLLEESYNEDSHSPLSLAATEGVVSMFKFMLARRTTRLWTYGPVSRYQLDLHGLDIPGDVKANESSPTILSSFKKPDGKSVGLPSVLTALDRLITKPCCRTSAPVKKGAIEYICASNRLDIISEVAEVRHVIDTKWARVGYPLFKQRAMFYFSVTVLLTLLVCLFQYQSEYSSRGWITWSIFPICMLLLAYKFFCELPDMLTDGLAYWGIGKSTIRGAAQLDNVCSSIEFLCFGTACFLKALQFFKVTSLETTDVAVRILICITVLTSYMYLYFFLLGFPRTGVFIIMVSQILTGDMPVFLSFFFIVLFGFGAVFALLTVDVHVIGTVGFGIKHYLTYIWYLFLYVMAQGNTDMTQEGVFYPIPAYTVSPAFYQIMIVIFMLAVMFLMLSLLIAMLTTTYEGLLQKSNIFLYREKYNIMCSFEKGFSEKELQIMRKQYSSLKKVGETSRFFFELEQTSDSWTNQERKQVVLLIVDPQIDFHPGGSLAVQGANEDSERIAAFIRKNVNAIQDIYVTLDSHHVRIMLILKSMLTK